MKCFLGSLAFLAAMLGYHTVRACDQCGVGTGGPVAPTGPSFGPAPGYGYGGMQQQSFQQRTFTTYSAPQFAPQAPMVGYGTGAGFAGASAGYMGAGVGFGPSPGCGAGAGFAGHGHGRFRASASTRHGLFGRRRSRASFQSH